MTDTKHTPGPWTAHRDPCHFDTLSDVRGGAKRDAQGISSQLMVSVGGFAEWKEQEANARLISAAPDLLDMLCLAADYLNGNGWEGDPRMAPIMAAIDKARGLP
jgi:hypothetical protein